MKDWEKLVSKSRQAKSGLVIILTAAALMELTYVIQYWYSQKSIRGGMEQRAAVELRAKNLEIHNVIKCVEVAVNNMAWAVKNNLNKPDSMYSVTTKLLQDNAVIVGSAIAFKPYYYKQKGRQFSPYSYKRDDGIRQKQLGSDQYDYHTMEWYTATMETGHSHWSEPYFDKGGGEIMMSTYSVPILDEKGSIIAVFTADVSLEWLTSVVNSLHIYPSSYNLLISRTGSVIACPEESYAKHKSIQQITSVIKDTSAKDICKQILAGKNGHSVLKDNQGKKSYVFYTRLEGDIGWSMVMVCHDHEIFGELRQESFNLLLLMLFGMGLLACIIYRSAHNIGRLAEAKAEKRLINNELLIASDIQKSMLPKTFPPYPERDDIEVHALLLPAKEVGGDLYDFYIRNEKLFFCIGDVSGKGVPASLVMAVTRTLFRSISTHEALPDRIVTSMNNSLTDTNELNMFVTLFLGVLDLPTGRLRYCNAGHSAPILISADSKHKGVLPVESNLPIGITKEWKFTGQTTLIDPQTIIFLNTDGITEAENTDHELFGSDRMKDALKVGLSPEELISNVTTAVRSFVSEADQSDDQTMLVIKYSKSQLDVRMQRSLSLTNNIADVPKLQEFVEKVCEKLKFDESMTMQMNLAIEEAVVNVMNYAYPPGVTGTISIEAQANDARLKFTIIDSGKPFDPTAKEEADTTLSLEERPIGGLGIYLVRQLMDSVNYERINDENILTLRKKF